MSALPPHSHAAQDGAPGPAGDVSPLTPQEIRTQLRAVLPEKVFAPVRWRGALTVVVVALYVAMDVCQLYPLSWPLRIVLAFVVGQLIVSAGLMGHEILHGAVYRSRFWQSIVGGLAFVPFFISPGFWRTWHVRAHHGNANIPGVDPDCHGRLEDVAKDPVMRTFLRFVPGAGGILPVLYTPVGFTGQATLVLWHHLPKLGVTRGEVIAARAYALALIAAEVALGWWLGLERTFFMLILPQLVANTMLGLYIATNHWVDPIGDTNDPLFNTSSVRTFFLFDWIHGWFSHHQEHHLYPGMNPIYAPLVQRELARIAPERQSVLPHLKTLLTIFRTPRTYVADDTLGDGRRRFPVAELKQSLK